MKLIQALILIAFISCSDFSLQTQKTIEDPLFLDLTGFISDSGNKKDPDYTKENSRKSNELKFKGFTVSLKTTDKNEKPVIYKNHDISYYVLSGKLLISESEKNKFTIGENNLIIIPRGTEHFLIPDGNKPVKLLVHLSN